jgi:hypothetical protein
MEINEVTTLLDLVLQFFVSLGLNWYESTFMGGFHQLPETLLSFLLSYLIIQLFFFIFPPIRKLMMILGAPFRYMHVWLHVDAARRIESKKYGLTDDKIRLVSFWGDKNGNDMNPLIHQSFTMSESFKIASAPLVGALALFIFLIVSSPIFAGLGAFGLLFHIYLLFCCFGISFPSLKDYSFLVKGNAVQAGSLHPGYVLWSYFIFAFSGFIALQYTDSAMAGFQAGIFYALIYLLILYIISKVVR